ncbi:MAG TPA: asparagine synthase-related protein, partial [Longimicrobiaceae bacterium]|nr:asparagine synthase-related protein [Longimicrobiaceae bacterium]
LAAYAVNGTDCLPELLGDFGFVIWNEARGEMVAARDACGVKPLFRTHSGGALVVGSRLLAISTGDRYDEEFVADYLAGGFSSVGRTPFAGCSHVPPGTYLVARGEEVRERRYWSVAEHVGRPAAPTEEREACEEFRRLFADAVRLRVTGEGKTWSQLSGGLDSSSIVSMAASLHEAGELPPLGGTVTVVDTLGDGDERRYSDLVVERYRLRNEQVFDRWMWEDDGYAPPLQDEPGIQYPFWRRNREVCGVVRAAGGRVILNGGGGDQYLTGDLYYTTDLLRAGRLPSAVAELARFAAAERTSFWALVRSHLVLPFLPLSLRMRFVHGRSSPVPSWVEPGFARRANLAARRREYRLQPSRDGGHLAADLAESFRVMAAFMDRGPYEDGVEMRYPFLYRPLVEMALRLPPEMFLRPRVTKWILREAMRGVLPEGIRTRRGKGGPDARMTWSLTREAPRLEAMLRDPLIGQMGWIRPEGLRAALAQARAGASPDLLAVHAALSLETWLLVTSGRWDDREVSSLTAA